MTSSILRRAGADDRQVMRTMLDAYLAELAQYGEVDLVYPWFDAYWRPGEARWPYMLYGVAGEMAGFALVNTHAPSGRPVDYAMAEFYVVPAQRHSGLGRAAVRALLQNHVGGWELSAMRDNHAAQRFWQSVLASIGVADLRVAEHEDGAIFRFRS